MTLLRVLLLTLASLSLAACDRREEQPVEPSEAATTVAPPSPDTQSTGTAPASRDGSAMDTPPEDAGADTDTNNIPPAAREEETAPSDPPDN